MGNEGKGEREKGREWGKVIWRGGKGEGEWERGKRGRGVGIGNLILHRALPLYVCYVLIKIFFISFRKYCLIIFCLDHYILLETKCYRALSK